MYIKALSYVNSLLKYNIRDRLKRNTVLSIALCCICLSTQPLLLFLHTAFTAVLYFVYIYVVT